MLSQHVNKTSKKLEPHTPRHNVEGGILADAERLAKP